MISYQEELPFEYRIYKKQLDIPLSQDTEREFDNFYNRVKESESFDVEKLRKEYETVNKFVVKDIRDAGNKKSIHTAEELQFIFSCSWLLIEKYKVSQATLATIWGMKENQFSKLDIYPIRAYEAYTKKTDKHLSPLQENSKGARIAECINKQVQAVHACWGFVGVTNDLDIFANIAATDTKAFVLTSPLHFEPGDTESVKRANYAFARYLFANGNRMFDDDSRHVPAGCIKDKIISLLNMQDILVMEQDGVLKEVLMSDENLSAYLTDGNYEEFELQREKYKSFVEIVQIRDEMIESGEVPEGIEYEDPRFGAIIFDEDEISLPPLNRNAKAGRTTEEIVIERAEDAQRQIDILEPQLVGSLNIRRMLSERKEILESWIRLIRDSLVRNTVILHPVFESKVRAAASFWISEVFKNRKADEETVDEVLDSLKRKELLDYIEALIANPAGKMEDARPGDKSHIYMISEERDILAELQSKPDIKLMETNKSRNRPLMIYIDMEAHVVSPQDMEKLAEIVEAVIIVHDGGKSVAGMGMQPLNAELGLYMRNSMEEHNGKK